MRRVTLDASNAAVKRFVQTLPQEPVELEMEGRVVCTVIPPQRVLGEEQAALIARGCELVRRSRQRNKGVPASQLKREIRQAVAQVRRRRGR